LVGLHLARYHALCNVARIWAWQGEGIQVARVTQSHQLRIVGVDPLLERRRAGRAAYLGLQRLVALVLGVYELCRLRFAPLHVCMVLCTLSSEQLLERQRAKSRQTETGGGDEKGKEEWMHARRLKGDWERDVVTS
jgi:hypothetical protein